MDQDSFRQLLQTPRAGSSSVLGGGSRSRVSLLAVPLKKKNLDASQPAFKPRNVKKTSDSKYRDRASERRTGDGNDYAQVEAVLEDFEKKNANEDKEKVEAQRKYLGGDSEHSVLVKGLDFVLLEQNKSKSVLTQDDIDALDQAYLESSSHAQPSVPKKRTREDLIRELKEKRKGGKSSPEALVKSTAEEEAQMLEQAKQKAKFKPIGFKPISAPDARKKKKTKAGTVEGEKKKKRKLDADGASISIKDTAGSNSMPPPLIPITSRIPASEQSDEPVDDNFDIFADAGEYEGITDDEGHSDNPATAKTVKPEDEGEPSSSNIPMRPIFEDEHKANRPMTALHPIAPSKTSQPSSHIGSSRLGQEIASDDEVMDDDKPMRLVPLSSSAVPSIKDLLAMDKAAGSHEKNQKRKAKKKPGEGDDDNESKKKPSLEEKVDRDYKRLKTYTDKKAAAEGK